MSGGTSVASGFYCLPGYNGNYYDAGGTSNIVTFFSMDFGTSGKNSGMYDLNPTLAPVYTTGIVRPIPFALANLYGPSSGHPSVINCLFGDGGVRGVRKDVDASRCSSPLRETTTTPRQPITCKPRLT